MPREPYRTVTINKEVYASAKAFVKDCKDLTTGMQKYRSMTHLVEEAITAFLKRQDLQGGT